MSSSSSSSSSSSATPHLTPRSLEENSRRIANAVNAAAAEERLLAREAETQEMDRLEKQMRFAALKSRSLDNKEPAEPIFVRRSPALHRPLLLPAPKVLPQKRKMSEASSSEASLSSSNKRRIKTALNELFSIDIPEQRQYYYELNRMKRRPDDRETRLGTLMKKLEGIRRQVLKAFVDVPKYVTEVYALREIEKEDLRRNELREKNHAEDIAQLKKEKQEKQTRQAEKRAKRSQDSVACESKYASWNTTSEDTRSVSSISSVFGHMAVDEDDDSEAIEDNTQNLEEEGREYIPDGTECIE